jgi:hypothetical protein
VEIVGAHGSQGRDREVAKLIREEHEKLGAASLFDLGGAKRLVALGKLSYYGFLLLSATALVWGLYKTTPVAEAATRWEHAIAIVKALPEVVSSFEAMWNLVVTAAWTWWFLPGLLACYFIGMAVDNGLEKRFSGFWHDLRARLHARGARRATP